jgi:hypothetical protein
VPSRIAQKTILNKKFWEEPIAYFPWYDTDHIEIDTSNNSSILACVFVTAVTFLPSRCLATIRGFLPNRCLATIWEIHTHSPQRDLISLLYFLAYFPYFEKPEYAYEIMLLSACACACAFVCMCVSVYPHYWLLKAWTNLYETWYVYHGSWAHLNGLIKKSLPSVFVSVCVSPYCCYVTARFGKISSIVAGQRLSRNETDRGG